MSPTCHTQDNKLRTTKPDKMTKVRPNCARFGEITWWLVSTLKAAVQSETILKKVQKHTPDDRSGIVCHWDDMSGPFMGISNILSSDYEWHYISWRETELIVTSTCKPNDSWWIHDGTNTAGDDWKIDWIKDNLIRLVSGQSNNVSASFYTW